jgi:hypothetical protein
MGAGAKAWGWDAVNKVWVPIQGNADGALILSTYEAAVAGEGHITILAPSYDSTGQGDWLLTTNAEQCFYGLLMSDSALDGDNISYKVYLAAGTYTLELFTKTDSYFGILDIDINDTEVASFDCYSDPNAYNVRKIQTGIVIATPGLYTLKCRVDGKNASSEDYYTPITYISLWRTA